VINWHERSLAPERQWGDAYRRVLEELDQSGPWFATATEAVNWFRWRRSIKFDVAHSASAGRVTISAPAVSAPGGVVRCFKFAADGKDDVSESQFDGSGILNVEFPTAYAGQESRH